jgi:Protein of unknown function (DUF3365)
MRRSAIAVTAFSIAVLAAVAVLAIAGCRGAPPAGQGEGLAPAQVVDYIHTVIQADRTTYARQVVERLQDRDHVIRASEHFDEDKALPLPAQMLRMGAQLASRQGSFHYSLISEWAINKANLPKTDFERQGLQAVAARPASPYTGYQTAGGHRYFSALYPDLAVSSACVRCHNSHPQSPRHDFKEGDVMGGVVISLPLGKGG